MPASTRHPQRRSGRSARPGRGRRAGTARLLLVAVAVAAPLVGLQPVPPAHAAAAPARDVTEACEIAPQAGFDDRPSGDAGAAVDCVSHYGVARGTSAASYSPGRAVTRAQMASFLVRDLAVADRALPVPAGDHFDDDDGNVHERNVNRVFEAGVTEGLADGRFGPDLEVTRAQMASFVARHLEVAIGTALPEPSEDAFDDDDGNVHERRIDQLAELGIVHGVGDRRFAPSAGVTRAQLALFLARSLDHLTEDHGRPLARINVVDATAGPDLVSASADTWADTVTYTFDQAVTPTLASQRFRVASFAAEVAVATDARRRDDDHRRVVATFEDGVVRLATTATVAAGAARTAEGVHSPEGDAGLRTLTLASGTTLAPDLAAVDRLGAEFVDFRFDEPAWVVEPTGYHLVLDDGEVVTSSSATGDGKTQHVVTFEGLSASDALRTARAYVDAGTVSDEAQDRTTPTSGPAGNVNPQQAVDVDGTGTVVGRPDLAELTVLPEQGAARLRFDEHVSLPRDPVTGEPTGRFRLFDLSGGEVVSQQAEVVDNTDVVVRFDEGDVDVLVTGVSADEGAVRSTATGEPGLVDELGVSPTFPAGRTAGPDLVRAGRVQRPLTPDAPDAADSSERLLVLRFDQRVALTGDEGVVVYDAAGTATGLTECEVGESGRTVVCRADSAVRPGQYDAIGAAHLAAVRAATVTHAEGVFANPEGAAVV